MRATNRRGFSPKMQCCSCSKHLIICGGNAHDRRGITRYGTTPPHINTRHICAGRASAPPAPAGPAPASHASCRYGRPRSTPEPRTRYCAARGHHRQRIRCQIQSRQRPQAGICPVIPHARLQPTDPLSSRKSSTKRGRASSRPSANSSASSALPSVARRPRATMVPSSDSPSASVRRSAASLQELPALD